MHSLCNKREKKGEWKILRQTQLQTECELDK